MQQVTVKQGILEGISGEACSAFLGVPYAQAPLGALRFRAPQPALAWDGVRPARQFSHRAWQMHQTGFYQKEFFSNPDFMPAMDEDCLYLNIWTPANSATQRLPVAFWIHGGAFINGFGSEMEFDGEAFARRGVILVTINYRLGAFGFLASQEITAENGGVAGNVAILDQIAALQWVQDNIAAFGGDPARVTIFGQSAGSISCQTLASSPLASGLFRGVILQSGGGYGDMLKRDLLPAEAYATGTRFSHLCGVNSLAGLRALPPETLMQAAGKLFAEMVGLNLPFYPVLDGQVLVSGLNASIEQGRLRPAAYLLGTTRDDLRGSPDAAKSTGPDPFNQSCIDFSLWLEKHGCKPAYVYYFSQAPQGDDAGAFHSSELWYLFGTLFRSWRPKTPGDFVVSQAMTDYWTNFIKSADPNAGHLPGWRPCSALDPYVQRLDAATLAQG
jgi:para-nitrobenzyl esterase